jgi:hypothetical protein
MPAATANTPACSSRGRAVPLVCAVISALILASFLYFPPRILVLRISEWSGGTYTWNHVGLLLVLVAGTVAGTYPGCLKASGRAALALSLVPASGAGLGIAFCCGHPLEWVGPSLTAFTAPLSFGYAVRVSRIPGHRGLGLAAVVLSGLQLASVIAFISFIGYDIGYCPIRY